MASGTGDRAGRAGRRNNRQDWVNVALALWLFLSPWILGFGGSVRTPAFATLDGGIPAVAAADAAWNAWVAGGVVFMLALTAAARLRLWQEWLILLIALWIFAAPWVVGFAGLNAAAFDHWIVGGLIFLGAASLLRRAGALGG
ncbi:MAG TPA: SPW repeat protein [Stellaceae bacterium]|nr:SPW repeat protein [Stellaceae bacterium]